MIRKIYLVHHTHTDIGYTDLPNNVRGQHLQHLDRVLDICQATEQLPEGIRFKWTLESSWVAKDYLTYRDDANKQRLVHYLCNGQIELQGLFCQPLTELAGPEELYRTCEFASGLGRTHGFKVTGAMLNDIAGYAWPFPSALAANGIRYLVAGDGGFGVLLPWADIPHLFRFQGPDGASVLTWHLGMDRDIPPQDYVFPAAQYGAAWDYVIGSFARDLQGRHTLILDAPNQPHLPDRSQDGPTILRMLTDRLEREGYGFEAILLQYGNDNGGPDEHLPDLVQRINDSNMGIEFSLATPGEFFEHMESKHASEIPVLRGAINDPWSARANQSPDLLARKRRVESEFRTVRLLQGLVPDTAGSSEVTRAAEQTWEHLHYTTEHTLGLDTWGWQKNFRQDMGVNDRQWQHLRSAWKSKTDHVNYTETLVAEQRRRISEAAGERINAGKDSLVIWNADPVSRGGVVSLQSTLLQDRSLNGIIDPGTGVKYPVQNVSKGSYLIGVPDVPGCGYRVFELSDVDNHTAPVIDDALKADGLTLCNANLTVTLDGETGTIRSILDKPHDREIVDLSGPNRFNQFVYHRTDGIAEDAKGCGFDRQARSTEYLPKLLNISVGMNGPLAVSLLAQSELVIDNWRAVLQQEVILHANDRHVTIRNYLYKPETETKEACYFAFPLAIARPSFHFDQANCVVRLNEDLLPGSITDHFAVANWFDVHNDQFGVAVVPQDAPLFQVGQIRTHSWSGCQYLPTRPHLYSFVSHNTLNTDAPIWTEIRRTFEYCFIVHGQELSDAQLTQEAVALRTPMSATIKAGSHPACTSVFSDQWMDLSGDSIQLVDVDFSHAGRKATLRLANPASGPMVGKLHFPRWSVTSMNVVTSSLRSFVIKPEKDGRFELRFEPHQTLTINL